MTQDAAPNIGILLRDRAAASPDQDAIVASDLTLSYYKLYRVVESYANRMLEFGLRPTDAVTINTSDTIVSVSCVFALALIGAKYITYDDGLADCDEPKLDVVLHTEERSTLPECTSVLVDEMWSPKHADTSGDRRDFPVRNDSEDCVWIVPSSGTSGRPKYSALSADLLYRRLQAIAEDYAGQQTRLLMLFHCLSRPFMIRAVSALIHGHCLIDSTDTAFAARAGANFACSSPQQIQAWRHGVVLARKIPVLQVSGAKLLRADAELLLKNFERVEDVYGSNETIKAHVNVYTSGPDGLRCRGADGPEYVEIVDAADQACPQGVKGQIRVKTPYMVDGYLGDQMTTEAHFRAGWFYPGDVGRMLGGHVLDILGRNSDLVNIGGEKFLLSDVEGHLSRAPGIAQASCFLNPAPEADSPLAACVVLKEGADARTALDAALTRCAMEIGRYATPRMFLVMPWLRQTHDGIVIRKEARAAFIETLSRADPIELGVRLFKFSTGPSR